MDQLFPAATVLGVPLTALSLDQAVATIERHLVEDRPLLTTGVNANVVNLAARQRDFAGLLSLNDLNYVDGQSLVWGARLLGLPVPERVATTDLVYPLAQMCERNRVGIFLLGGRSDVVAEAAARLVALNPTLEIDWHDGYFADGDDERIVDAVRRSGARVLLVGMGDPKQLSWSQAHRSSLPVVVMTCGGLFDWVSGRNRRPPQWMVRAGLEWLWRVIIEPRRLLKRYLVGNPEFLYRLGRSWLASRRG